MSTYEIESGINSTPVFQSSTSKEGEENSLIVCTDGLQCMSLIIESISDKCFENQELVIFVSNDRVAWTKLKSMTLGAKKSINYNLQNNWDIFANPLHFRFIMIYIPALRYVATRILASSR